MSKFVRAAILALATVHDYSGVRAITLRTLLENQISADTALRTETALHAQEQAVLNIARDIQELSFAQIQQEQDDAGATSETSEDDPFGIEQAYAELAHQLVDLSQSGDLGTLKECLVDVRAGTYQTSKAAKLAAGTLEIELDDNGMQQGELLVSKLTADSVLLAPGDTITGMDGQTVAVHAVETVADEAVPDEALEEAPEETPEEVTDAEPTEPTVVEVVENDDDAVNDAESEETEKVDEENKDEAKEEADPDNTEVQESAENAEDENQEVEVVKAEEQEQVQSTADDTANQVQEGATESAEQEPELDAPPDDGEGGWFGEW